MQKFEYMSVVLQIEKRNFSLTRSDLLKGITADSTKALNDLGENGWELVSIVDPSSWGGTADSLLAFLKRAKA